MAIDDDYQSPKTWADRQVERQEKELEYLRKRVSELEAKSKQTEANR